LEKSNEKNFSIGEKFDAPLNSEENAEITGTHDAPRASERSNGIVAALQPSFDLKQMIGRANRQLPIKSAASH
jgi:hypothetical protein